MTLELKILAWTLVLAFVQILLFDVARTGQYGLKWNTGPRDVVMPPLSARTDGCSGRRTTCSRPCHCSSPRC